MKYAIARCVRFLITAVVALGIVGCDPVKELDWDRTARDQGLRIGNRVRVEGVSYGLPIYKFKKTDNYESVLIKKNWGTELDFWTYNPNNPTDEINPNAPIGTVIGTIYNPMYNETLKPLRKMYPDEVKLLERPRLKHRFEIVGRIHSFKRAVVSNADDTKPDISRTAVRINVESMKHVESINLKE